MFIIKSMGVLCWNYSCLRIRTLRALHNEIFIKINCDYNVKQFKKVGGGTWNDKNQ